ncbi:filamentous hemagglutinin N-terminal domain-containing protein, partial [Cronobacter sakazakii]|nr:filamentous hemagglutinin N-terminal domain-containing protein [Cronobacter sakazakii]
MNHIYKLKFDKRRNEIVVVSEITTGPGKVHTSRGTKKNVVSMVNNLARSVLSVLILAGLGSPALAAGLPVGGQVVAGSASIQKPTENQMNIHQNSAHAVLNWNSFDIGQGHTVQFYQPDSSAVALNRVVGGNESHIMGNLNANGRVFLVNPNGVLFGKGASVNTAGLVATTRDIKNEDFMNGKYVFSGQKGQGEVVNQGNLTTTKGGFIVLAGDRVRNSGTIRTPEGRAVLAAAEKVTLQLDNAGLTSVAVNGSVVNALVENSGLVSASDGQVLLTARGKNMLMNTVLNNSGVVEAQGLSVKDGNIVLDGGDSGVVQHSGTLMADNNRGRGGKVVVEGQHILLDEHSRITATGRQGGGEVYVGGGWQGKDTGIRHAQKVVMLKGANIDVSATEKGNGGTAVLWSDEYTRFHGNIQAKGGQTSGNGGQVETSSHNNLQAFGQVDASAATGRGGEWLLDPADITIVDNGTNTNVTNSTTNSTSVFTPDANATTGQVGVTNINNLLNNGTSVNITTSNSAAGNGSITVNAAINKTNGTDATLTLFADGNITVNKNITSSNGALNVNLFGANSRDGAVNISRSNITTNNGNLTISHGSGHNMTVAITNNTTISAGTGNISIDGQSNNKSVQAVNITGSTLNASSIMLNGTALADTAGVKVNNSTLNASQNITMTANSAYRGVLLQGANISANSINIAAEGRTANAAVWVEKANSQNTTLNASSLTMTGNTSTGKAYGLYLTNMTLLGNIADFQNTTLSSAGSAGTNTIGAGVITTDTALKNVLSHGIENDTTVDLSAVNNGTVVNTTSHAVNLSGLSQLLSSGAGGRDGGGDVTVNLTGNKSGGWRFSSGVEDLSTTGNIALSGLLNPGNLTSTAGSILVNGGELLLANLSLSAAKDVTLNGRSVTLNGTNVTSTNGSVNITGNNTLGDGSLISNSKAKGVWLNNANITAMKGNISILGVTNQRGMILDYDWFNAGTGVMFSGNTSLNAIHNNVTGIDNYNARGGAHNSGIFFSANLSIQGETLFTGSSKEQAGGRIWENGTSIDINDSNVTMNFSTTSTSDITSAGYYSALVFQEYDDGSDRRNKLNISLHNANLTINADASQSTRGNGISNWSTTNGDGITVRGQGGLNLSGTANSSTGVFVGYIDNTALNGTVTICGSSSSGTGVAFIAPPDGVKLVNAIVTGHSASGTGLRLSTDENTGFDTQPRNINLNGNIMSGTSQTG